MNVKLLTSSQSLHDMENFAAIAALTCHANTDKEYVPAEVLKRRIKDGHESVLEHINLTYSIGGLSRACLQELARHRHISLSVESTRYTLRKILGDDFAVDALRDVIQPKFWPELNRFITFAAENTGITANDELKYYMPEFWPTNLILTSNIREFRHILNLRTSPQALKEFRILARSMFNEVPEQFKYLLQDCVHEEA